MRHGSMHQNRQVIVAQYIGTGNLMGQLSQGKPIILIISIIKVSGNCY